jgi:hypothetical protein
VSYERGAPHRKEWSVGSNAKVRWRSRRGAPLIRGAHTKYSSQIIKVWVKGGRFSP